MKGTLNPQQSLAPRVVLVASQDGRIVGFIAGHLTWRYDCDGEVEWINVIPERTSHRSGRRATPPAGLWFVRQQAKRICVDVDPENAPARAFYRKHGAQDLNPHWLVWPDIAALVAGREPAQ
jgi:hypothetical protein